MTSTMESSTNPTENFELFASRQWVSWMQEQQLSLGFTTYQTGKVFLIGTNPASEISVFERSFNRPMGLCAQGDALWLASLYEIHRFTNLLEPGQTQDHYDRLYAPQVSYMTSDLDVHDMAVTDAGKLVFVNTLFSCLATTDDQHSFTPIWQPPFISKLAPEDRCHLNGLALRDGKPRYVTAIADTDVVDGWRDHRKNGGILMDVLSNEIIADQLSMPHSPRWYQGKLWLANAGTGEFGFIDQASGQFEPIAFCPGYIRGVAMHGDYAVVGLSKARQKTFQGLALDERLASKKIDAECGLYVIHLKTGNIVHWLKIQGMISELYDVAALPGVTRPSMVGFKTDQIRRTTSIGSVAKVEAEALV